VSRRAGRAVALAIALAALAALGPAGAAAATGPAAAPAALSPAGAAAATGPAVAPVADQALVVLLGDHVARTRPSLRARRVETVRGRRPLTKVRTVLPVLDTATGPSGRAWLQVRLPGRPNAHTGWIAADRTRRAATGWSIDVRLGRRLVTVSHYGGVVRRFRTVIGTRATPTPRGRFFVEEAVALGPGSPGGPFALALSARSTVLQEFAGGPGQTALHGTRGLSGALGSAASHGCLRLSTRAITWLARRVDAGTPVHVRG
jgi:lipoprotein-anchoring transpeptidase ErfK/SrfK